MNRVVVAIATPLDPDLIPAIEALDARIEVRYQPDLLPPARFAGDHIGAPEFHRSPAQEGRWRRMLADAEIVYGIPGESGSGLAELVKAAPALRWVQATSEAVDQRVNQTRCSEAHREPVSVTTARGIRVTPSAEFAMLGLLASARRLPQLLGDNGARRWNPHPADELAHQTLLLVGLDPVAVEIARLATAFGMEVLAINRTGRADVPNIEIVRPARFLADLLPAAHAVVISLPPTEQTRGLIGAAQIARMRRDAAVILLSGAGVIDERALIEGLRAGQPAVAVLDTFAAEPLPPDSPLWNMPNVLVSPHTAALSTREDMRLAALFTENLDRYLRGEELVNQV